MENEMIIAGKYTIPVLYEDNHLLVVVKPANMPSQPDASKDADMLTVLKAYIGRKYNKPGNVYLGLVHRLDRPVGGVMVFARTSKAASRLSEAFREHVQDRRYLAVCEGEFTETAELNDLLLKDKITGNVSVVEEDVPGAKAARLITRPIACADGCTLTEAQLFTGRSHQIRVQHAHFGHPLWGDMRYGNGTPGNQIALWAWQLSFEHPTKRDTMTFVSRPPEEGIWSSFSAAIDAYMR